MGYIVMRHPVRTESSSLGGEQWTARIPAAYREHCLGQAADAGVEIGSDPHCLAVLRRHEALMPLAREVHKPIFHMRPADGAMGALAKAVQDARRDYEKLARVIATRAGIPLP